jgi:CD109 antigen
VRNVFPETWIWEDFENNQCDDDVQITKKVPDTITSWYISAFALNRAHGLGFGDPATLTVFKRFFVSLSLPYSVKRGETLTLSVQIFNYLSSDQEVTVSMNNEYGHFNFTDDEDSNFREYACIYNQKLDSK